jgi:hypothetical protein
MVGIRMTKLWQLERQTPFALILVSLPQIPSTEEVHVRSSAAGAKFDKDTSSVSLLSNTTILVFII